MDKIPEIDIRYKKLEIGQEFGPASFVLDLMRVKQYKSLFDSNFSINEGDPVPPFMVAMLSAKLLTHQNRPAGSIHVSQKASYLGEVPVGTTLYVRRKVINKWISKGRKWLVFSVEGFMEDGTLVYRAENTSILPE